MVSDLALARRGDSISSGGFLCPIGLDDGLVDAGISSDLASERYSHHPDHGAQIEGIRIPQWEEIKQLSVDALAVFPHICFVGADIAVGRDGPVVIELNVVPDKNGGVRLNICTREHLRPEP